jgi:hypothetical protein
MSSEYTRAHPACLAASMISASRNDSFEVLFRADCGSACWSVFFQVFFITLTPGD